MSRSKLPTYYVSHGGGPWPWLKEEMPFYSALETSLKGIASQYGNKPKAILMISGHWEENEFSVMSNPNPPMLYDYSGFPPHTYKIKYPACGVPELAHKIQTLARQAKIPLHLDSKRGFDHGAYCVAFPMYPAADVPMIQLSIKQSYDPETHLKLGEVLAPLREENILIIGSGLSFHNMNALMGNDHKARLASHDFDEWLQKTLVHSSPTERRERLLNWESAPGARLAHPQEDHLLPLLIAVGAATNEKGSLIYHEKTFGGEIAVSSFKFGED